MPRACLPGPFFDDVHGDLVEEVAGVEGGFTGGLDEADDASETALNQGDFLDQITMHIAKQWPKQASSAVTAPSAAIRP